MRETKWLSRGYILVYGLDLTLGMLDSKAHHVIMTCWNRPVMAPMMNVPSVYPQISF